MTSLESSESVGSLMTMTHANTAEVKTSPAATPDTQGGETERVATSARNATACIIKSHRGENYTLRQGVVLRTVLGECGVCVCFLSHKCD